MSFPIMQLRHFRDSGASMLPLLLLLSCSSQKSPSDTEPTETNSRDSTDSLPTDPSDTPIVPPCTGVTPHWSIATPWILASAENGVIDFTTHDPRIVSLTGTYDAVTGAYDLAHIGASLGIGLTDDVDPQLSPTTFRSPTDATYADSDWILFGGVSGAVDDDGGDPEKYGDNPDSVVSGCRRVWGCGKRGARGRGVYGHDARA